MATTFDVANFKNLLLNWLSGSSTGGGALLYYGNFYNGVQAANPSATPAGSLEFSSIASGIALSGKWAAADSNSTAFLSVPISPTTPAGAAGISNLTTARLYTNGSVASMDTPLGIAAGAGVGAVVDSLTSSAGVGNQLIQLPFKMPTTNGGTLFLSIGLANRLVDLCTGVVAPAAAAVPQMGINTNGSSVINVYSGAVPADADAPLASAVLLFTITIGASQLWATASGGSLPMSITPSSAAAVASGTASFARMVKTNGSLTYTIQGSAGAAGTDFVIGTTTITSGNTYTLTDAVITL